MVLHSKLVTGMSCSVAAWVLILHWAGVLHYLRRYSFRIRRLFWARLL